MPLTPANPKRPRALCAALRYDRKQLCRRIATLTAGPDDAIAHGYAALVAAVEATFRHEEVIMETLGFERLHTQRQENAIVLSALHRTLPDIEAGDCILGRQILAALSEVLALHRLSAELALVFTAGVANGRARGLAARTTQHVTAVSSCLARSGRHRFHTRRSR